MQTYSIADLEKLSGIKSHTIRIWEKRYELVKPLRTDTNISKKIRKERERKSVHKHIPVWDLLEVTRALARFLIWCNTRSISHGGQQRWRSSC